MALAIRLMVGADRARACGSGTIVRMLLSYTDAAATRASVEWTTCVRNLRRRNGPSREGCRVIRCEMKAPSTSGVDCRAGRIHEEGQEARSETVEAVWAREESRRARKESRQAGKKESRQAREKSRRP